MRISGKLCKTNGMSLHFINYNILQITLQASSLANHMASEFSFKCHLILWQINVLSCISFTNSLQLWVSERKIFKFCLILSTKAGDSSKLSNVSLKMWIHSKIVSCHIFSVTCCCCHKKDETGVSQIVFQKYNAKYWLDIESYCHF